jgi:hypothetical protein
MNLNIKFQTQQNNKYWGDCGMAMIAMLADITIEEAYAASGLQPGIWANFNQLEHGLKNLKIDSNYARLNTHQIKNYLTVGWPVIALIDYGRLPNYLKNSAFDGAHFVLCVGFNALEIAIHDPLGNDETGAFLHYNDSIFSEVHYRTPANYNSNQCLVVQKSYAMPVAKITKKQRTDGRFNAL